jgi:hypothetical protein
LPSPPKSEIEILLVANCIGKTWTGQSCCAALLGADRKKPSFFHTFFYRGQQPARVLTERWLCGFGWLAVRSAVGNKTTNGAT